MLASRARVENWGIPEIVGDLVPNENLLGYGPIDILQGEAQSRIEGFNFPTSDNLAGRLQYCPELMMRVNTVVKEYKDRFKCVNIGLDDNGARNYIKSRPTPSNLTYVTSEVDNEVRLSLTKSRFQVLQPLATEQAGKQTLTSFTDSERTEHGAFVALRKTVAILSAGFIISTQILIWMENFSPQLGVIYQP